MLHKMIDRRRLDRVLRKKTCIICGRRPALDNEELCALCWPEIHHFAKHHKLVKTGKED
ncbi:hypothetical protein Ngar_c26570 [Candidatus Nitrososphaera gargensis Ga9.2]|uniref:Uncharacterized protein n=1 Tax=Nitrososphaera gargensis (strain Ga9.2) TaxID=1237085 RepID=K0IK26_NITGG|nr:hypothetical protein Ngar_c26570 [Candidatus Nitrososphaera gargensis Ga9.2]